MSIERVRVGFGLVFLAFFALVWANVCWDVIQFEPTITVKEVDYNSTFVTVAGGLATTISAAVGAIIGVKSGVGLLDSGLGWWGRIRQRLQNVLTAGNLVLLTLVVYGIFSFTVGLLTLFKTAVAPEMLVSFGLSIFSLIGAAFTAAVTSR